MKRIARLFALFVLLAGCSARPVAVSYPDSGAVAACARFYQSFDRQVASHGVGDAQAARIAGYPHLRVNRFLASFRETLTPAQWSDWLDRLRGLGIAGEMVELANLPPEPEVWRSLGVAGRAAAGERLAACGATLLAVDKSRPDDERLRSGARVADAYRDELRVLGLYPLTALPVRAGVARLHAGMHRTFARPAGNRPVAGKLVDYLPPAATGAARPPEMAELARDALGMPQLTPAQRQALFARHAPIWRIDVAGPADRPGQPFWWQQSLGIDTSRPVVYEKLSYTRWRGEVLLQLNYIIWFPARPLAGPLDILGGHLDGITWRVTLAPDGRPLVYDAMHNCGCYHMAFPARPLPGLVARATGGLWQEPLVTPATAPVPGEGERLRIRLAARSHYLQNLAVVSDASGVPYASADYAELRSLPRPGDRSRSLFADSGLITGTERRERWLLWPMGVPSPGAMRQWGHHATAFVGRRHFDDPFWIERYFRYRQ